ncbi:MAG: hypothetical protein HQK89_02580 [Nitrospirae bacterium]|nr:hypothetical protein [Nitrospirota bacterium]
MITMKFKEDTKEMMKTGRSFNVKRRNTVSAKLIVLTLLSSALFLAVSITDSTVSYSDDRDIALSKKKAENVSWFSVNWTNPIHD